MLADVRSFIPLLALALFVLGGCAPTISMPRGKAHLDALAEGERHASHGRFEDAATAFALAASKAQRRVDRDEALYRESRMRARLKQYDRAITLCDEIAALKPPSRRTLRARLDAAHYRIELGQIEPAEEAFRAIMREQPDSGEATSAFRALYFRHVEGADPAAGIAYLDELGKEVKGKALYETVLYQKGLLLEASDKASEARVVYEDLVKRYPYPKGRYWDNALVHLSDIALKLGEPKAAIDYLEQMLAVQESSLIVGSYTRPTFPQAAISVARIYRDQLHDVKRALEAYRRVEQVYPQSQLVDDAITEAAELELAQGDPKQGCQHLAEVLRRFEVGRAVRRARAVQEQRCSAQ